MRIHRDERYPMTAVPNRFIDEKMPAANGEFVKIYLYLLRASQGEEADVSVAAVADRFFCTENDVVRALRYWEREGMLVLGMEQDQVASIRLTADGGAEAVFAPAESSVVSAPAATKRAAEPAASEIPVPAAPAPEAVPEVPAQKPVQVPQESPAGLPDDEEFREVVFVAEAYLGRTLTPKDVQLFAYLYDQLHFPSDLLVYLVEYCVEGGHRSNRYMETVALGWHQEGLLTVEAAREAHRIFSRENKAVMKAFGITGRALAKKEQEAVTHWLKDLAMPLPVVEEACGQTMSAIQKPSFEYTSSILEAWHEAGIRTAEEARDYSEKRRRSARAAASARKEPEPRPAAPNRFQNYQGRDVDYDALVSGSAMNPYRQ